MSDVATDVVDQSTARTSSRQWLGGVALVAMTLLVYLPIFRAGFIWDDDNYVTSNLTLRDAAGLKDIWLHHRRTVQYYPLTLTTFWVEHHLWGDHAVGYHIVNVLLHALSAVMVWRILKMLSVPGAWFAAAVWAIHPVNVESVGWVTERKNVLSAFFYLLSFITYWKWLQENPGLRSTSDTGVGAGNGVLKRVAALHQGSLGFYFVSLLLFLCALFSKTTASTLPAALLLVIWWKKRKIDWREALPLVPFFIVGIAMGQVTAYLERTTIGASGAEFQIIFIDRFIIAMRALWFYFFKLIWPTKLMFIYPKWGVRPWMLIFPIGVVAVVVSLSRRRRWGTLVGLLFFAGTLFPALGFINVYPMRYSFVADHFQYLASIGVIAIISAAGAIWLRQRAIVPAVAVLAILGALTWERTHVYRNLLTLWEDTLEKNPSSWMVHASYGAIMKQQGDVLAKRGRMDDARQQWDISEEHYLAAVTLKGDEYQQMLNIGGIEELRGNREQAMQWYRRAADIAPNEADPHYQIGRLLAFNGHENEAIAELHRAIELNPGHLETHKLLGKIFMRDGKKKLAIAEFRAAVEIEPRWPESQLNLADALAEDGKIDEAIPHWEAAIAQMPESTIALNKMGSALAQAGRLAEAEKAFRRAIAVDSRSADSCCNLGIVLEMEGNKRQAIALYRQALRLAPEHPQAQARLKRALQPATRGS